MVLERILNEWLVHKYFLQMSAAGQTENLIAGTQLKGAVRRAPDETGEGGGFWNLIRGHSENVLTVSDVLPCPLVVLEERMPLDLIETIAAQSNFPVGRGGGKQQEEFLNISE